MQECRDCKIKKPMEDFHWKNQTTGKRQTRCKPCERIYGKAWYKENRKRQISLSIKRNAKLRKRKIEKLYGYLKKHPCVDCGEDNPILLDFDHIGEKTKAVSGMIDNNNSWERILGEIAKCEVRCVACHRLKTAKDFGWYMLKLHKQDAVPELD